MSKASFLQKLGFNHQAHSPVLQTNEQIIRIKRVHWWVFSYPLLIILFSLYLLSKTSGYFTFEFLLYLPEVRPSFVPAEIYKYMLMGMEEFRNFLPQSIHDFMAYTKFRPFKWISQLVLIYGLYKLVRALITFLFTKITLTDRRIIVNIGLIRPQKMDIPLAHLAVFHEQNSFFSRFLNVSTLILQSAGGFISKIPAISNPDELRNDILAVEN